MKRIAILASGYGSNFEILTNHILNNKIKNVELTLMFTNNKNAFVIERADFHKIKTYISEVSDFDNKKEYNDNLLKILLKNKIDYIILAGYMLVIPKLIIQKFPNKIINIHPSYLPYFKGLNVIEKAYNSDVKFSGVTVHFVNENIDSGDIILQKKIRINHKKTLLEFEKKIHSLEHKIFYKAINKVINKSKRIQK